MRKGNMLPQAL